MGRRKTRIKLPFLKVKINRQTVMNIFGFLIAASGVVLLISFLKSFLPIGDGRLLILLNEKLVNKFGWVAILLPVVLLFLAAHFFNTRKLKLIKPNITGGLIFVFIALLGILQSGEWGKAIFQNLSFDFFRPGAVIILTAAFIIGLVLFLDTSIDVFLVFVFDLVKLAGTFLKDYVFRSATNPDKKEARLNKSNDAFIEDNKSINPFKPIPTPVSAPTKTTALPGAGKLQFSIKPINASSRTTWVYPPISLLADFAQKEADRGDVKRNADIIEKTLDSFGIRARVSEINNGPAVTQYALEITMGTKVSKITTLANDLALALAAPTGTVRIEAPIPGRSLVGIEIPNKKPEIVTLKKMLSSPVFANNTDPLLVPLGLDVSGQPQAASIGKMPHVLIAGATGSGKSVILNAWLSTFLFRTKPEDLRLILVDPKRVEFTLYNGIPNLLTEVIIEADKIIAALRWTIGEMETRYKDFAKVGVRNLEGYNVLSGVEKKPYIIFIIDELADLMIVAPGDAEELITRIAQMARATGIHLVLATQRPSVNVITGLMKANIPTRLAFSVSSMVDSRVIIDMPGAEKLLGKGDMLYLPPEQAKPRRIQGPFLTEKEIGHLVKFLKSQVPEVHYTEEVTEVSRFIPGARGGTTTIGTGENTDKLFNQAVDIISQFGKASASLLQRRLRIGYARAARLLDQLEAAGYIGQAENSKAREIIKRLPASEEQANESV
ncbi:DNA translocase FtsK [Candidatus Roizmanbacteria bacterium]|nr:DNA translocase FtsK [Candidatus Roizmanbacteria bacterium]